MEHLARWPGYVSSLRELLVSLVSRNLLPPLHGLIPYQIMTNSYNSFITMQQTSIPPNLDSPLTLVEHCNYSPENQSFTGVRKSPKHTLIINRESILMVSSKKLFSSCYTYNCFVGKCQI